MKSNPLTSLLAGLLLFSSLAVAGLCFTYVQSMRTLQKRQAQAAAINQNRAVIQQLLLKSMEYGKTDPAMEKILKDIGLDLKSPAGDVVPKPGVK